jgi:hypothetical protein
LFPNLRPETFTLLMNCLMLFIVIISKMVWIYSCDIFIFGKVKGMFRTGVESVSECPCSHWSDSGAGVTHGRMTKS